MAKKKAKGAVEIKHDLFVLEWLKCFNATEAYTRVYKRASRDTAMRNGSDLLRKAEVQKKIQEHFKARQMEADEVLGRLGDQARGSHRPFIRVHDGFVYFDFSHPEADENLHLIKKIKTKRKRLMEGRGEDAEEWEHEWVEVELHDQQRALELIGKHLKLFNDKMEITHTLDIQDLDAALDKIYGSRKDSS